MQSDSLHHRITNDGTSDPYLIYQIFLFFKVSLPVVIWLEGRVYTGL